MTYTPTGVEAQVPAHPCAVGHVHHSHCHHTPHQQTQMACDTPRLTRPMALYPPPPSSGMYDRHTRPSRPECDMWHHSCHPCTCTPIRTCYLHHFGLRLGFGPGLGLNAGGGYCALRTLCHREGVMSVDDPLTLFFLLLLVPFPLPVSFLPCVPSAPTPPFSLLLPVPLHHIPLHHISALSHSVLSHAAPGSIVCSCGPSSYYIVSA